MSRRKVVIDECIWELAAKSNTKAGEVILRVINKPCKLVFDAWGELTKRLVKKLSKIKGVCAAYVNHILHHWILPNQKLVEYREPIVIKDAPKEDVLIVGIAVMADILITEDENLKRWFRHKMLRTEVLDIDDALSTL